VAKRSQVIVDDYLRQIVSGEIVEGQLLPTESVLIDRYQVSRTAVREAIQTLATKGFVQIRQGSGSTVAPRSSWNVLDQDYLQITGFGAAMLENLLEARDVVEPAIAGIAAVRAKPDDVLALRRLVAELAATSRRDLAAQEDLEAAFHHRLAECSDNPVLISLHGSIWHLARLQRRPLPSDAIHRVVFWHEQIVDALAAADAGAAADAMRLHLRQVRIDAETVQAAEAAEAAEGTEGTERTGNS
jgi:DNA-binding FadR family transcriptional regulator